jgi:hypothetical protein
LVGLVFSLIQNAQNIGYLIPVEEIRLFLADIADGVYNGKPQMFDLTQTVENDALRRRLGLPRGVNGVMVAEPYRKDPDYPLKEWDVITRIGDTPIDSDGKVAVRYDLRVSAPYLVQKFANDGVVPVTVFRNGGEMPIKLPVQQDYLDRLGNQRPASLGGRPSPLITRRYDKPDFGGEELVIVASPAFPDRISKGYDDPNRAVLSEINGVQIRNLRLLVELIRDNHDSQITLKFAQAGVMTHETMVFNRVELLQSTSKILEENGIRYPYSPDLRSVWDTYLTAAPKLPEVTTR